MNRGGQSNCWNRIWNGVRIVEEAGRVLICAVENVVPQSQWRCTNDAMCDAVR